MWHGTRFPADPAVSWEGSGWLLENRPEVTNSGFAAFRHRDYRYYFAGQLVSVCGDWMQTTALSWMAFHETGLSTWPAMLAISQFLPSALLSSVGGRLADRYGRRKLLLISQSALLLVAACLAALAFSGNLHPPQMIILSVITGLCMAVDYPTRSAYVRDLVGSEDLTSAVGLGAFIVNGGRALGPAIAGMILVKAGPPECFLANALSYVGVLAALLMIGNPGDHGEKAAKGKSSGGMAILSKYPGMASLLAVSGIMAACGWPYLNILPALAQKISPHGAYLYSFLVSCAGLGALVASGLVTTARSEARRRLLVMAGSIGVPLGMACLSVAETRVAASLASALVGTSIVMFFSTSQSVVQLVVRQEEQGRVIGVLMMIVGLSMITGNAVLGVAADHYGLGPALMGVAALSACGAAYLCFGGALKRLSEMTAHQSTDGLNH